MTKENQIKLGFQASLKKKNTRTWISRLWFQILFIFTPYLGKIPILTNIYQMGWFNSTTNQIYVFFVNALIKFIFRTHVLGSLNWFCWILLMSKESFERALPESQHQSMECNFGYEFSFGDPTCIQMNTCDVCVMWLVYLYTRAIMSSSVVCPKFVHLFLSGGVGNPVEQRKKGACLGNIGGSAIYGTPFEGVRIQKWPVMGIPIKRALWFMALLTTPIKTYPHQQ